MDDHNSVTLKFEARLAQVASELYDLAYIQVDANLSIVRVSPNLLSVLGNTDQVAAGIRLTDALDEFFGSEQTLRSILHNELPSFKIENINRARPDGSLHYLTFHVLPLDPDQTGSALLVVVEDVTRFGLTEQNLLQKRNELSILQGALSSANAELDRRVEQRTAELVEAKQKIELQLFRLQALRENDHAILGTTDLRVALRAIAEQAKSQLSVDLMSILVFNPPLLTLETVVALGAQSLDLQTARVNLGESMIGRAALDRRTLSFPDLTESIAIPQDDPWAQIENLQACYSVPLIAKGNIVGVLFLGHRSWLRPNQEWLDFLESLAGQAAMAIESIRAFEDLQRSNYELALAYNRTIEGWSRALDLRDRETKSHTSRVTETTMMLVRMAGMNEKEIMHVKHGALLHDIGKVGIPDSILLREDKLTDDQWEIMRRHPVYAYEMLFPIEYLRPALDIPYCHHERWDGSGYPRGLKGEEIPLAARIFAVVDVWDALSSDRPYRQGWPAEKVYEYIRSQSGTHFDPQAVDLFLRVITGETPASDPKINNLP